MLATPQKYSTASKSCKCNQVWYTDPSSIMWLFSTSLHAELIFYRLVQCWCLINILEGYSKPYICNMKVNILKIYDILMYLASLSELPFQPALNVARFTIPQPMSRTWCAGWFWATKSNRWILGSEQGPKQADGQEEPFSGFVWIRIYIYIYLYV